jgi:nucleoside-diphosphate-sugar epimerase
MASDYSEPLNLGTEELVSIDTLVEMVCGVAGKHLLPWHNLNKPQGVRGRNSDNTKLREVLDWEPQTNLLTGLTKTYKWIEEQCLKSTPSLISVPTL